MRRALVILALAWAFFGCEQEPILFEGPYFVRFTNEQDSRSETELDIIEIPVHLAGPAQETNLDIQYSVGGDAREGVDYEFVSPKGQVRIVRGQNFGTIEILLINNANNILESQDIELTIESINSEEIAIGQGESQIGRTAVFTILDACILSGGYTGTRDISTSPITNISVSSFDCREYQLSNWDINIEELGSFPRERTLVFVDNFDNTITIPEQEEETLNEEFATIRGTGSINPFDDVITLNIELVDFEGSPVVTINLIPDTR